ncbi:hypothetical protein N7512_002769 [Penicillium capsulatum]|nr:hypothetical protein N7512_002769 [Penicillium capsulatum]
MRGDLARVVLREDSATHNYEQNFMTYGLGLDQTDLSDGLLAAHFDNGSIAFYQTTTVEKEVEPLAWIHTETDTLARSRYSKFLSSSRIAVASGKAKGSLAISSISPDGVTFERDMCISGLDLQDQVGNSVHANATAIAPLNTHQLAGSPGDVFLAAWGDRTTRLHDLRSPHSYEATYRDTTDINLIYSVHPFGQDRFLAGAGGDAVVKIFDLRMRNSYSYLDAQTSTTTTQSPGQAKKLQANHPRKDFSFFLSTQPSSFLARHSLRARRAGRYRGPVYTMSSPSPSSPTVYTGVVDGVVRLDFASTDDLTGPSQEWYNCNLDLGVDKGEPSRKAETDQVLRLAGYERPDPDDLSTTSKLRNQHGFWYPESKHMVNEAITGWDRRWEPLEKPGVWRRRDS